MKTPPSRIVFVFAVVIAAGYALLTLRGPGGLASLVDKQHEIQSLETANAALKEKISAKQKRVKGLMNSPALQEIEIREKLKLMRRDERAYVTPNSDKN